MSELEMQLKVLVMITMLVKMGTNATLLDTTADYNGTILMVPQATNVSPLDQSIT